MLDWFTGVTLYDASHLTPDIVYRVSNQGDIAWSKECYVEAVGSYDEKLQLQRAIYPQMVIPTRSGGIVSSDLLRVSGNPTKYLQGHNAFGLGVDYLERLIAASILGLPETLRPVDADIDRNFIIKMSRVDIAKMINLGSHEVVHRWIQQLALSARRRRASALMSGDTVYIGMGSRRWNIKAYCKACELLKHPPLHDANFTKLLHDVCEGMLRMELTLRGQEIEGNPDLSEDTFWKYFDRLQIGAWDMARVKNIDSLSNATQGIFWRWYSGDDGRTICKSIRTYYRHRRLILDSLGVDIDVPRVNQEQVLEYVRFNGHELRDREVKAIPDIIRTHIYNPEVQLILVKI